MSNYARTLKALRDAYRCVTVDKLIEVLELDDQLERTLRVRAGLDYSKRSDGTRDASISACLDDVFNLAVSWQRRVPDAVSVVEKIGFGNLRVRAQMGGLARVLGRGGAWRTWMRAVTQSIDCADYAPELDLDLALEGRELDDELYYPIVSPWTGAAECYSVTLTLARDGKVTRDSIERAAKDYVEHMRSTGALDAALRFMREY